MHCPKCNAVLDSEELYFDDFNDVVGCEYCITTKQAWEYEEELKEIALNEHFDRLCDERRNNERY